MSNVEATPLPVESATAPETPLSRIKAAILQHCSPERQYLLQPIIEKLEEHPDVPASTGKSRHGAFTGGLLFHIDTVMRLALSFSSSVLTVVADGSESLAKAGGQTVGDTLSSAECVTGEAVVTSALLHDLNKIEDFLGNRLYVPNILTKGNQSEAKPWRSNDDYCPMAGIIAEISSESSHLLTFLKDPSIQFPSGLISLALAGKWSPGLGDALTDAEAQAIVWHAGLYDRGCQEGFRGKESLLQITLHAADMIASRAGM